MSRGVIGIDGSPGRRRPRWWQVGLAAFLALGAILWIADTVVKTDTERAAQAYTDFIHATAKGDGERVCELVTEESREQLIAVDQLASGQQRDCAAVAAGQIGQVSALGGPSSEELADLEPEHIEDATEIRGDRAIISTDVGLVDESISLVKAGGDWLVDLPATEVRPGATHDSDPSQQEIIEAADRVCTVAYPRTSVELAGLAEALETGRSSESRKRARAWAQSERQLSEDLGRLARLKEVPELAALIRAVRIEAAAIEDAAANPRVFLKRQPPFLDSVSAVVDVASRGGFAEFGCAAPTVNGGG